jgi:acyl-CoA thioester hydrolase
MFETEFQMRLRDLNTANHVDNLEIMRVADEARALFFGGVEGSGGGSAGVLADMPAQVVVLAAAQHAEFRQEISWVPGASYAVRSWVGHIGSSSFTVESEIRTTSQSPDAVMEATIVLVDQDAKRPWRMNEEVREALAEHLADPIEFRPRAGA